ncbi:serine/threonine kinase [Fragilaria crotonensis]|nr:serine/threonine kinase [Fragilaria crotonensis]
MPLSDNDVALFFNAYDGNLNKVRALLLDGANVNAQDSYGATALYIASQNGHLEVVRELLQHDNVDVNLQCTDDGATALYMASQQGHLEVVRELLQHDNVDVNLQCTSGATALYTAIQNGHVEVVRKLLQIDNVDVNIQSTDGTTALYIASQDGHLEVVRELLQHDNVDVNLQCTNDGTTALYMASQRGRLEVVRELLHHGKVEVNLQRKDGRTALHTASRNGHVELFRELLQHENVEVNAYDENGDTALIIASHSSNLDVVRELLRNDNVDVNAQNKNGETALFQASREGNQEVVKKLLEHNNVDVNLKCNTGATALHIASQYGRVEVFRELLQNSKVDANIKDNEGLTAFDVAYKHRKFATIKAFRDHTKTLEEVNKNRESLAKVMTTCKAEPVELSYHYIKHCIKIRKLGSGAYGNVFLVEDGYLPEPKKFVVKMMNLSQRTDGPNDEILISFQKELSTLKRFRHPNIIVLYGYNFKGRAGEQFLVYEYAANGSLDCFLKDDDKRALLPADNRLSIMYQVAKAVHCLHTGAAGVKVYHRDIKSANICLMNDFTPKLIDCGLATFVLDRHEAVPSESILQSGSTQGTAIGTHLYRCPEYISKKGKGINCDYIPAYDVYSFGVVMAELIIGHLNDGKATNVLQTYVLNEETPIVDGWKQLKNHADGRADWNAEALELVCKTVIGCITLPSERRLSTGKLRDLLKYAKDVHNGITCVEPKDAIADLDNILHNTDKPNSDPDCAGQGLPCYFDERLFVVKCKKESHPLCAKCLEKAVWEAPASTPATFQLRCLVSGCPSQPFTIDDICEHVPASTWSFHWQKRADKKLDQITLSLKDNQKRFDKLSSAMHHCLKGLAWNNAHLQHRSVCPTLVVITRIDADRSKTLKTWFTNPAKQKYEVTFYCERSGDAGHDPFEISVDKQWMVTVLPLLQIAIDVAAAWDPSKVLLAVCKTYRIKEHTKEMKKLIKELADEKNHDKQQTLEGKALKAMADMAKEHESEWRTKMEPVLLENGRTIWVKKVDDVSHDDDEETIWA